VYTLTMEKTMSKTTLPMTSSMTSKSNWDETREYFKEKTNTFKELKKRNQIELMKKELELELKIKKNNK
jgi:hypothetical protein